MKNANLKAKKNVSAPNTPIKTVVKKSTSATDTPLEAAKGNDDVMSQPPRKTEKKAS